MKHHLRDAEFSFPCKMISLVPRIGVPTSRGYHLAHSPFAGEHCIPGYGWAAALAGVRSMKWLPTAHTATLPNSAMVPVLPQTPPGTDEHLASRNTRAITGQGYSLVSIPKNLMCFAS